MMDSVRSHADGCAGAAAGAPPGDTAGVRGAYHKVILTLRTEEFHILKMMDLIPNTMVSQETY